MKCIFCEIAAKDFDAKILSETDTSLAFLDIDPVNPGHTLVIPKTHYPDISDAPNEVLSEMFIHAKDIAGIITKALGATGFNILNANGRSAQQSVFHLHLHIVPRFDGDGKDLWFHGTGGETPDIERIFSVIRNKL